MNSEQLKEILARLRERMNNSPSVEEFDRMLEVRNALRQWGNDGSNGEIPFAEELRGWNIELPGGGAAPAAAATTVLLAPTEADVAQIVQNLRSLLMEAEDDAEWDAIQPVYRQIRRWKAEGMNGPLPEAEQLAHWGVWSGGGAPAPAPQTRPVEPVAPAPQTRSVEPVAPAPQTRPVQPASQREQTEPQATVDAIAYDEPAASTPSPRAGQRTQAYNEPQVDYDLQYRYEDALADLREGNYYQARNALRELQREASGSLAQQVRNAYQEASQKLQAETRKLVREARRIKREGGGLQQQTEAWKAVQRVNPESREVNQALAALSKTEVELDIQVQLSEVEKKAKEAAEREQLPDLNKLLGQVSTWKALGEKTPPEISDSLYQQVVQLEEQINKLRQDTRASLGESSTLLAGKHYRRAYERGLSLLEKAVPKIVDVAGQFGPVGREVDTGEFFRKAQELFISSLQSLAGQRLSQAEGEEKQDPERALETLKKAQNLLTDSVLSKDDRAELKPFLDRVLDKQQDVQRRIDKYNQAKQKVILANRAATRVEALALYQEAKEEYPDYPNLHTFIERAQDEVVEVVATDVAAAIASARRQMQRERYELALQTLASARTEAIRQVAKPKPNSGLAKQLAEVRALEEEIADAEHGFENMMVLLKKVDEAIERFDQGDARGLRSARNLLEQLNERERKHNEVRQRLAALQDRQGDMDNWDLGQEEYRQRNWVTAQEILRQVAKGNTTQAQEAAKLADRALACQYAEDAQRAELLFDFLNARSNYEQVVSLLTRAGTDSLTAPVLKQCQEGLQRLAPLQQSDERVRQLLSQATSFYQLARRRAEARRSVRQQVQPIREFASAVRVLMEASEERTTMAEKVNDLLREVQSKWRETYLNAMNAALSSSQAGVAQKALELAEELRDANLIYEIHEEELARNLMLKALDNEYERLMRQGPPKPWDKIAENRQKRMKLQQQGSFSSAAGGEATAETAQAAQAEEAKVADAYREAVRKQILDHVHELKRQGKAAAAKAYLVEELQKPALRADPKLVAILIELCWELSDWQEAELLAVDLAYQNQAVGEVWNGLTRAARWFKEQDVDMGRANLEQMRERHKGNAQLLSLIDQKQEEFSREVRNRLVRQAEEALALRTDDGYIDAAEKFAKASVLAPNDPRITMGLQRVGQRLGPGIRQRCTRAKNITIGQRKLQDAVKEIGGLHGTLNAIYQVVGKLRLDSTLTQELKSTLDEVTPKYERWKEVQESLNKADRALQHALQTPQTEASDRYGSGVKGWNFGSTNRYIRDAKNRSQGDRECRQMVQRVEDGVRRMEDKASEIQQSIKNFMDALDREEFDAVTQHANKLGVQWRQATQQDAWGGLNLLIDYHYPWYGRNVNKLDTHKQLTNERKANLQEWERWSNNTHKSYSEARKRGRTLTRNSLDDLRYEHSLSEIIQMGRECIQLCDQFQDLVYETPKTEPLSRKAEGARDRIEKQTWENEITVYRGKAALVRKQAEEDLNKLLEPTGPLRRLKQTINTQILPFQRRNRAVPANNINRAKAMLKQCEDLDPNHDEVKKYSDQLAKLGTSGRGQGRKPKERWLDRWLG